MARLPRISPADVLAHVILCGNNRQVCFAALGASSEKRQRNYRTLFDRYIDVELLKEIEILTGRRIKAKKGGRLLGW